jgi:ubiquitin C-terminal hydrolase
MYQYKLIGSIHHHGTLNNGHFYAEIQYEDGKWYKISD